MSNWYGEWLIIKARKREALRDAERQRLVEEAFPKRNSRPGLFSRILLTAGTWLVEKGWRLQRRANIRGDVLRWGKIEIHRWVDF